MTLPKIAVIALAALLVTAGAAAAMPGEAPDHSGADGNEQATDARPDEAGDGDEAADGDASDDAGNASAAGERAQVPDVPASDDADENATEMADDHSVVNDDEFAPGAAADEASESAGAADAADAAANAAGPAVDLPEQVPDHVSAIHDMVADFLSGDLEGPLGPAVSDVAAADDPATNATG